MNNFRLLEADEIECRVSQISEKGLTLLLYKTARTDANLLDETVGEENWTNDFKLIDGVLYGGIGIDYGQGFVWKWDAGTESQTEAEKGRASDAFKRAGSKHGIGRELYSAPRIWISAANCKIETGRTGKLVCYDNFYVGAIEYDDKERISRLIICIGDEAVFEWTRDEGVKRPAPAPETTKKATQKPAETKPSLSTPTTTPFNPTCKDCGAPITDAEHDFSVRYYKAPLCRACQKKHASDPPRR